MNTETDVKVRSFKVADIEAVVELVRRCQPRLDLHKVFDYWKLATFNGDLCCVLELSGHIIGFASAELPDTPAATVYLWQLAILPEERGKRYASKLIEYVARAGKARGCTTMMFSIAADNWPSLRAFESFADMVGASVEWCAQSGTALVPEDLYRLSLRNLSTPHG